MPTKSKSRKDHSAKLYDGNFYLKSFPPMKFLLERGMDIKYLLFQDLPRNASKTDHLDLPNTSFFVVANFDPKSWEVVYLDVPRDISQYDWNNPAVRRFSAVAAKNKNHYFLRDSLWVMDGFVRERKDLLDFLNTARIDIDCLLTHSNRSRYLLGSQSQPPAAGPNVEAAVFAQALVEGERRSGSRVDRRRYS